MDVITLRLKEPMPLMAEKATVYYDIVAESKPGILLSAVRDIEGMEVQTVGYWFPKSRTLINGERLPGKHKHELDKIEAKTIRIERWLWDCKKPAPPMGCK